MTVEVNDSMTPSNHQKLYSQITRCFFIQPARYRNETNQSESYYLQAAHLVPSNGQPYNQLAIVAASKADQLAMTFYYIRSIAVKHPFPAAATNLQTTFSKLVDR